MIKNHFLISGVPPEKSRPGPGKRGPTSEDVKVFFRPTNHLKVPQSCLQVERFEGGGQECWGF